MEPSTALLAVAFTPGVVLGESMVARLLLPASLEGIDYVAVRLNQRPVCSACVRGVAREERQARKRGVSVVPWTVPVVGDPFPGEGMDVGVD